MRRYVRDPLLIVSVLLSLTGAVQASTNYLAPLLTRPGTTGGVAAGGADVVGTGTPLTSLPGSRPEVDPTGVAPPDTAAPGSSGRTRADVPPAGSED